MITRFNGAEVRLGALILVMAMAAGGTWFALRHVSRVASLPGIPWPALAAAFVAAELGMVRIGIGRHTYDISLSELPLVIGLLFVSPVALLLARTSASLFVEMTKRRPMSKRAFNVAIESLEAAVAVLVFRVVLEAFEGRPPDHFALGWRVWLAAISAVVATTLITTGAVTIAIAFTEGRRQRLPWAELGVALLAYLASTCLAVLAAVVVRADPADTWLLAVPAVLLLAAHWAYMTTRRRHARLHAIYEYTREVGTTLEAEPRVRSILDRARQMLRTERAELLVLSDEEEGLSIRLGPGDEVDQGPADEAQLRYGRYVLAGGSTVKLPHGGHDPLYQRLVAELGPSDRLGTPVRGPDGPMAVLVVSHRVGDAQAFDADDVDLLEALANVAGVALHNDQLIDQLHRLVDQLRQETLERTFQASHDWLTGLASRRVFDERATAALAEGGMSAVMLIDLDRFKEVNDTLGHHSGDRLLREAATRLKTILRDSACAARLGGDEFAVMLPEVSSEAAALDEARTVCAVLDGPYQLDGLSIEVGASAGLAVAPEHGITVDLLLQRADMAMYEAKAEEGGVILYTLGHDLYNLRRLTMVGELKDALQAGLLDVAYQPILSLSDRQVIGIEALARWPHSSYGEVTPDEFVPLAEQAGLIRPLTDFVLARALEQCGQWRALGFEIPVHVNLSVRSLRDPQLVTGVEAALDRAGFPAGVLGFEVTEGSIMGDARRALDTLSQLRALGVRLAIDDFGAGQSSLSYLQRLPVDMLKIDQSFVLGLAGQRVNDAIVRLTVELGQALGLRVVAEGVEDQASWERLRAMGCEAAQGHLLARPMPAEDLMAWLAAGGASERLFPESAMVLGESSAPLAASRIPFA